MDPQELLAEVVDQLKTRAEQDASEARVAWFQKQHKGSKLKCYGIRPPQVRRLIRKYSPLFHRLSLEEKLRLAIMFYRSDVFEQATVGDALLELGSEDIVPDAFDALDEVVGHFHNWASVDQLCLHTMQPLLRKYREETLELLRKWNRAENLWKRRASVVSLVRNIGSSGDFLEEMLELCENLIWDKEDLVLKGVGWALRDSMKGDKTKVIEYVKSLRRRGVSSRVTLYAIEHLKGEERNAVLKVKPQEQSGRR